jgi:hypothetical protein
MPSFRKVTPASGQPLEREQARAVLADAIRPANFYTAPGEVLAWEHVASEEVPWEILHGQLLDRAYTQARQSFETWNVYRIDDGDRSAEPLLSLKLDAAGRIHVTRAIHCHAWEGYDAGNNVFLSRETTKWVRELVGTIDSREFTNEAELRDEVICRLFLAVVGVSRLPLTSVEAPLPDFTLGRLTYCYQASRVPRAPHQRPEETSRATVPPVADAPGSPVQSVDVLIQKELTDELSASEQSRLVEVVLRSSSTDITSAARLLARRWQQLRRQPDDLLALLRRMFDEVALSPYTNFVDATSQLLGSLSEQSFFSAEHEIDFHSYLLRHVVRHLTAYDLITFHHQGANYPDALLLDAVLKTLLIRMEATPALFVQEANDDTAHATRKRIRRRALRQALLLRHFYDGFAVPDAPTSPGENQRILPPPHTRVPEEQILQADKRTRRLYADDPLRLGTDAQRILAMAFEELVQPAELRELGLATFLDRPLGIFKAPMEPDQTPLFASTAFSRRIAGKRLDFLAKRGVDVAAAKAALEGLEVPGIELPLMRGRQRPGKVSLDDARKVSQDFVFLGTSRRSIAELRVLFDFSPLQQAGLLDFLDRGALFMRGEEETMLAIYDSAYRKRLELTVDASQGYASRGGVEFPRAGVRVVRAWDDSGVLRECASQVTRLLY